MCDGEYPIYNVLIVFVCSYKEKAVPRRVRKVSHVLHYSSWCDLFFEVVCVKDVVVNQGVFYFVDSSRRLGHPEKKVSAIPNYVYDVNL